ncbi:hypothetical protein UCDDA912_g06926 [Diaporthe ampelina]|uniref:Uncharacterized protein n=1 Tax=Diaporthe ampelina TaxID=1214573 RepID=A0A0G2FEX3_9PEZI|nr:hypothetical protein UCDDA912_g06926 [Diaporthe ampelina]
MLITALAKQIFAFSNIFIENLQVLRDGRILLSTLDSSGLLYVLDPSVQQPSAIQVANLPSFNGTSGVTGMAPLGTDRYAVTGGVHTSFAFEKGSMHVYIVSLQSNSVVDSITVPDAPTLNGLAALPQCPHVLLSADSIGGRILRIDTRTKKVTVAVESDALTPGSSAGLAVGINGLRVHGGYVYFTNSNQGTFARFRIDKLGNQLGAVEVIARATSADDIYDDFTFDFAGNAYVAVHSYSVVKITPGGVQSLFYGGDSNSWILHEPTSVALANDGLSIYVSTGGNFAATPVTGGQVVQIWL